MSRIVTAEAYLVLEPKWSHYRDVDGQRYVAGLTIARMTQNRPSTVRGDAVVMKVCVTVPEQAFQQPSPTVVIDVPEDMLLTGEDVAATVVEP